MRRREFIALLGGAATWSLAARAQDAGRTYRIRFLLPSPRNSPAVVAMFDQLRLNGFVEGQNLIVIPGGFGVPNDQIAGVVASLVAASPDVIVAGPELPLRALSLATRTIPLVGMSEDMVADGLVASFARPGGNITGISLLSPELDGKRQEILIEAVPGVRKIAVLVDSNVAKPVHLQQLQQAAENRGTSRLRACRQSTFWRRRCFPSMLRILSRKSRSCAFRRYTSFPKARRTEPSLVMAPVSPTCIVCALTWPPKFCAVQRRPTSRSSSRRGLNSLSI